MVETQSCVHVIYVLQESKEVLHLLKCDALCDKEKWTNLLQILPIRAFQTCEKQPTIVKTRAATVEYHIWRTLGV